jgi:hypothetical protein
MDKKKVKHIVGLILLKLVFIYFIFVGALYLLQRHMVYFPDSAVPSRENNDVADMDIVTVQTEDGLSLQGWYKPAQDGKPTIITFHGNGGNIGWRGVRARMYLDQGFGFLMAEYRGYGGNEGVPSEEGFYKDARAYLQFLKDKDITGENLVVLGESLGTGVAVKMVSEHPDVRALILETPFTSVVDVAAKRFPFVPVSLLLKHRYESSKLIADINVPILVLHAKDDKIVPFSFGERLYNLATEPKEMVVYETGGHIGLYKNGAADFIMQYIENLDM